MILEEDCENYTLDDPPDHDDCPHHNDDADDEYEGDDDDDEDQQAGPQAGPRQPTNLMLFNNFFVEE